MGPTPESGVRFTPPSVGGLAPVRSGPWVRNVAGMDGVDDAGGGRGLGIRRHRAVRARAPVAKAAAVVWAGIRGLVSPATWLGVANVTVSLVVGTTFFLALLAGLLVSVVFSWIVGIGSASCTATLRLGAKMARFDRRRIERLVGNHIDLPPLPQTSSQEPRRNRTRAWMHSPAAWRLVGYQLARLPVAGAPRCSPSGGGGSSPRWTAGGQTSTLVNSSG